MEGWAGEREQQQQRGKGGRKRDAERASWEKGAWSNSKEGGRAGGGWDWEGPCMPLHPSTLCTTHCELCVSSMLLALTLHVFLCECLCQQMGRKSERKLQESGSQHRWDTGKLHEDYDILCFAFALAANTQAPSNNNRRKTKSATTSYDLSLSETRPKTN
eukprot:3934104-Rhodomonas_salina.1